VTHYGRLIPGVLGDLGLPESELVRHIAWDIASLMSPRCCQSISMRI